MKTSVIIPIKSFSKSKSRLNLSETKATQLCEIMLKEILQVISETKSINDIILVTKDESALDIGKKFNCIELVDDKESGVKNSVILVPSRQFNGTNALVRYYASSMKTQYDKGSYSYQLDSAKSVTQNVSLALIRRIMLDIDDEYDLTFMLKQNEKPDFCKKIRNILDL